MNLFECKVRYQKVNENGKEKVVSENYLLDAVSFSDAEERINKELEPFITGEFSVIAIKLSTINEVVSTEGDTIYKGVVNFLSVNEETGSVKKVKYRIVVNADDIELAYRAIESYLADSVVDSNIISVSDSNLIDYFPLN